MSTTHASQPGADLPVSALATIEALRAERHLRKESEAREFRLIAHLADLHSEVDAAEPALPGRERLVQIGSDGTPEVAEGCALELAADLHVRPEEAHQLIATALDCRHRLPELWGLVQGLEVPVHQARHIAHATHELDATHAGLVDLELSRQIIGMSFRQVKKLTAALVLRQLDAEQADQRRADALEARGVWVAQSNHGVADIVGVVDAADAILLDAQLDRIATILETGGTRGTRNALRARAVGILANPPLATQLLQVDLLDQPPTGEEFQQVCARNGQAGHVCGTITVDPDQLLPKAQLVVHLTDTTLATGEGLVRCDQLNPLLAEWLPDVFGHHRFTVRPVIDQNHQVPSDSYECPPTMREAVILRNPWEVFPWSTRTSPGLDLDHTVPWQPRTKAPRQARGAAAGSASPPSPTTTAEPVEAPSLTPRQARGAGVASGDQATTSAPRQARGTGAGSASPPNPTTMAEPVEASPPTKATGQTHPDNLGPLSRLAHRAKTHFGWRLYQPLPGIFLWQTPLGYRYLRTPSRTLDLGRPDTPTWRRHEETVETAPAAA
ncbi:DUF222 domain-containing protein [Luteococcus sp. H138]|uniref:DUF222 domain-containing protein n=1 Tax=unclassified Luteococcus TaxID=2639923 RepID=UPI00313BB39B